jgi:transposase-like protein
MSMEAPHGAGGTGSASHFSRRLISGLIRADEGFTARVRNQAHGGAVDMAELCRKYGVARPTGYAWVKRFGDAGHDVGGVEEKSRRPHFNPDAISAEVEDLVVQARKLRPRCGPRKLHAALVDREPLLDPDG